jgi:hypothetical protein
MKTLSAHFSCKRIAGVALASCLFASNLGHATPSERELNTGLTEAEVQAFLKQIKEASAAKDPKAMAKLVKFPLRLNGKKKVRSSRRLIARYDKVFNDVVTKAIEGQRYETLFSNYQGVMIGDGQIWFKKVCRTSECTAQAPRIISVNNE